MTAGFTKVFGANSHVCTAESCPPTGGYYVSAVNGDSFYHMAGPYDTHAAALADVDRALKIASEREGRAWFMSWGTLRRKDDYRKPGTLNKYGLMKGDA